MWCRIFEAEIGYYFAGFIINGLILVASSVGPSPPFSDLGLMRIYLVQGE